MIEKVHAQKYIVKAERGKTKERNEALKKLVWKHSHFVEGAVFSPKYKSRAWNGRSNVYSPTNIQAGFLYETIQELNNNNVAWFWKDEKEPEDLPLYEKGKNEIDYDDFYSFCSKLIEGANKTFEQKNNTKLEIRDYQVNAAYKFLQRRLGIALQATGAGKSLMIAFIIGYLFYKNMIERAVIIVPLQSLVTQFTNDLIDFGFNRDIIGQLYSDVKQTNRPITIALTNSVHNLKDTADGDDIFSNTDLVICDEVHKACSKTVKNSIMEFHNAKYFFGCTGTLPENDLKKDIIFSLFGYVLDKRKLKELEEDYKAVSTVKIGILNFCYESNLLDRIKNRRTSTLDWREEVDFLQNDDEFRNEYIIQTVANNFQKGQKIVVLVKNIEFGNKLFQKISERVNSDEVFSIFASGEESKKLNERDEIIHHCKETNNPYILVTNFQIFSTGVNIPKLSMVLMCDAGKSKITVAQTIGRGVRRTKQKTEVLILDCACDLKYGSRHKEKRKKLYAEEGFIVFEKKISKKAFLASSIKKQNS